jgi:hypothetical protein
MVNRKYFRSRGTIDNSQLKREETGQECDATEDERSCCRWSDKNKNKQQRDFSTARSARDREAQLKKQT